MEIPSTLCSNLYDFAFCPEPCYDRLADLADPEDWGLNNARLICRPETSWIKR